jgi:hypothetical protein
MRPVFYCLDLPPPPERSGKDIRMSRTNKKHTRNIQCRRRNKGPELLSKAADNKLQELAPEIASALCEAAIQHDTTATGLLLGLAESAEYGQGTAVVRQACDFFEAWAREPQVVMLDTEPRLEPGPQRLQLTDGSGDRPLNDEARSPTASEEILDAEVG